MSRFLIRITSCFWLKYFRCVPFLSRLSIVSRWTPTSFWKALCSSIWPRIVSITRDTGFKLLKIFSALVNQSTNACKASWNSVASLRAISSLIFLSEARAVTLSQRFLSVRRLCCKLLAAPDPDFFRYSCPCCRTVSTLGRLCSNSVYTSMNLSSCSDAVSGKPPTGFEAAITPSTSPSHDRRSWISAWNLWASRRASSSSCCLSAAFASKSLHRRFNCDNFSCVAEASAVPLPDSIICRPASLSVSTLVWCAWISFTSTFSFASSTSRTCGSPATGLSSSNVPSVLSIQTNNSARACWNCPRRNRAFSSCLCRSTIPRRSSSQRRFTAESGSLIAAAWSADVLSVSSCACLLSASTFTIWGSTSALKSFSCSICLFTASISVPRAPIPANLSSALSRNSNRFCKVSWNSIAFSIASMRFSSLFAYSAVTLSHAESKSSICFFTSGLSGSPHKLINSWPVCRHWSTSGLVWSISWRISCKTTCWCWIAAGSTAGGSCELSESCKSCSVAITLCNSSQNLSATTSASSRDFPLSVVAFCTSFHKLLSRSSLRLMSLTAGSARLPALLMTSSAALFTAAKASVRLSRSSTKAAFSSIWSRIRGGWAETGSAELIWSAVDPKARSIPSSLSENLLDSCNACSSACCRCRSSLLRAA